MKEFYIKHILGKLAKVKDQGNIESCKRITAYHTRVSISITANYSPETTEPRGQWDNIFIVLKEKICKPRILLS